MNPNDFGKKFVVEEVQKIRIGDYLKNFQHRFKEAILGSILEILKQPIELTTTKTGFNGVRFWFKCPICNERIGVLYIHPLDSRVGCRTCLNLDYKKRRYKGMVEEEETNDL